MKKYLPLQKKRMGAPKGNKFWKLRAKHGRDKLFETPALLWDAACEYFEWVKKHPLIEIKYVSTKFGIEKLKVPKMRAMTLRGLCFYLNTNEAYFRTFKAQLPNDDKDFNTILTNIEDVIYNQKFEGAAAGFLNANIIARDLGLKDKSETEHTIKTDLGEYSTKELIERAEAVSKLKNE